MFAPHSPSTDDNNHDQSWLLPDLRPHYTQPEFDVHTQLGSWEVGEIIYSFFESEIFILRCFVGRYTPEYVQKCCSQRFPGSPDHLVENMIARLIEIGVLAVDEKSQLVSQSPLKPDLQWIEYRHWWLQEKIWLLRNPDDRTYVFMNEDSKEAITLLETNSLQEIAQTYPEFSDLWQNLKAESMLQGTSPAKGKRHGKFHPMQLLFFDKSLGNPDPWLSRHVIKLGWLWSRTCGFLLLFGLIFSGIVATSLASKIGSDGQNLWKTQGSQLLIPFVLWSLAIVTLHELGHCFTLKHYARQVPELDLKVPEVGVMFMCLMPTAYCQTTDSIFLSVP
jgi:putative peptide zinc metalloprotease protein